MLGVRLKGTSLYAAEYDSTKAAIDTVEARMRNHKGRLDAICDRLTALEGRLPDFEVAELDDRLTALEAKASYKKIDALERRINTLMGSITALEAKVKDRRWQIAGAYYPITEQPPNTCGNCAKAWRRDKDKGLVLCEEGLIFPRYKANGVPACSHHARREEV